MADSRRSRYPFFSGVDVAGVNPSLLQDIQRAVTAIGGTGVVVTSAKRPPGLAHNDVKNSNHITGDAIDGYAVVNGKQVPIGQALLSVASRYGLRSGDVPGFDPRTPGGYDPIHVDDGANVGGVHPTATTPQSQPRSTVGDLERQFIQGLAQRTGLAPQVLQFWTNQEGAYAPNGTGGLNFLNLRPYSSDTGVASTSPGGFDRFSNLQSAVDSTAARIEQPFLQQYLGPVLKQHGDPAAQWKAIAQSGWDAGHYAGVNYGPAGPSPGASTPAPSQVSQQLAPPAMPPGAGTPFKPQAPPKGPPPVAAPIRLALQLLGAGGGLR